MTKRIFLVLVVVILLINLAGCGVEIPKNFSELDKEEQESFAELFAEDIVKDNLKAPSTAKVEVLSINDLGDNKYEISGYVDAENSFGAKLRNNFTVEIKINEDYEEDHDGYSCKILSIQIK
jgi:predicted small lipoprotein YifL